MTLIAFGRLSDCNFLVADRIGYAVTDDPENPETFGLKKDKIVSYRNGYFTCTGDRLVFDFLMIHNGVYDIPTYDEETARSHFVNELNSMRREQNVLTKYGRNSGVMFCTNSSLTIWRIKFDKKTNTYITHDYRVLSVNEQCVSWFGKLYRININDKIDSSNFVEYYAWQLNNMLLDPVNVHMIGNFNATDFILDEVNYAFITPDDRREHGALDLPHDQ